MARSDLPEELIEAGKALLATTDTLAMQAHGAMWLYDHSLEDWRYYLVTSLVDTLGRRKTYRLLLEAFEKLGLPKDITIEDVYLGSPSDPFFLNLLTMFGGVNDAVFRIHDMNLNGVLIDAVIYRSIRTPPSPGEANRIEKQFSKRVRDLAKID